MGVTKPKIYVTADPALLLEPGLEGAVDGFLLGNNMDPAGRYALFVLRDWPGFAEKKQAFMESAKYVKETYGLTPVFFALEPGRDLPPSREVASELPFACPMLSAPSDEKLIIGMMKKMQVVVSMRLHALIFASSVAAPLVAVSYDPAVTCRRTMFRSIRPVLRIPLKPQNPQARPGVSLRACCARFWLQAARWRCGAFPGSIRWKRPRQNFRRRWQAAILSGCAR